MNPMEIYLVSVFIINLCLGIGVFFTNRTRTLNQYYLTAAVLIAYWLYLNLKIMGSTDTEEAILLTRLSHVLTATLPATSLLMRWSIIHPDENWFKILSRAKLPLLACLVNALICFSPFLIDSIIMPTDPAATHGIPDPQYGWGYWGSAAIFLGLSTSLLFLFVKDRKKLAGLQMVELDFIATGSAAALGTGILCGGLINLLTASSITVPLANVSSVLAFTFIISYGIATKRILKISTIARRIISTALLICYLLALYLTVWKGSSIALNVLNIRTDWFPQIAAALATAFAMAPAHGRLQQITNMFISSATVDIPATMKKADNIFQSMTTLSNLQNYFSRLLTEALDTEDVRILLLDNNVFHQTHPFIEGAMHNVVAESDALAALLRKEGEPVTLNDLNRSRQTNSVRSGIKQLNHLNASIAIGIFSKSKITGIVLLGERPNGRIYDKSEQNALQILCNQLAGALENARLYTEMQDSKIRNEIMLDKLVSGIIVAGPDRKITLFNHEAQRITGIDEKDAIGMDIIILPLPIFQTLDSALKHQHGTRDVEASLIPSEETEASTRIRMGSSFLFGYDGNPMGALLVFTNITELKSLEEQVRRSDQLSSVGTLAAGMAHEIKNPLVTIKTFTQLLPERYEEPDFRDEFASLVSLEVSRIDGIVNELLSFSKPAKPTLSPIKLQETIDQTLKLINEQLTQRDISLITNFRAENDLIMGDSKLLSQALVNLQLNAIEAIGEKGAITIGTSNCNYRFVEGADSNRNIIKDCVRLHITDTGSGMEPETLKKIFDPFYTSKSEGTGMGLSVANGIISEHLGTIEVDSIHEKGTSFHIYLPILEEESTA